MKIQSPRLILRALDPEDLDDFLVYRQDEEVCRYQGFSPYTKEKALQFLQTYNWFDFSVKGKWMQVAIEEQASGKLIGDCALRFLEQEHQIAEVGCTLNPQYQGQGYAGEALRALITALYDLRAFHKIVATLDARNQTAIRLIEQLGFQREAILRQHYFDQQDQRWIDEWAYGLLAEEFKK